MASAAFAASNQYPLHLVERHFLGAAVVELRGAGAGVVRHLRGAFESAAVFEGRRNARRPKRMVAHARDDASGFRAPLNHRVGVRLGQGIARELAGRAAVGLEQQRLRIARESRAVDTRTPLSVSKLYHLWGHHDMFKTACNDRERSIEWKKQGPWHRTGPPFREFTMTFKNRITLIVTVSTLVFGVAAPMAMATDSMPTDSTEHMMKPHTDMMKPHTDMMKGDAMKGDAMKGHAMKGDAMKGHAMKGDAMKSDPPAQ